MFTLASDAVDSHGNIDTRYSFDADNSTPELRWSSPPPGTASFVLLLDSSTGPISRWVVYNIPSHIHHLPAGIPPQDSLQNGICQGINSFGKLGYTGPSAIDGSGSTDYVFRLYSLNVKFDLPRRMTRERLLSVIAPYVVDSAELHVRYEKAARKAG
ncbi:MAG: YbhB/YbcL family Raf kinase inhibitor-like protein [Bdellovibrionota bacterium]